MPLLDVLGSTADLTGGVVEHACFCAASRFLAVPEGNFV
jgi:hypothetical protein